MNNFMLKIKNYVIQILVLVLFDMLHSHKRAFSNFGYRADAGGSYVCTMRNRFDFIFWKYML